jgi:serine/threonine protein kinase
MGTVYLAEQEHPRRDVAIKVMHTGLSSRAASRRFEYESEMLGRLRHPGIATVYEAGTHVDE